ncbi:hypothetical protein K438DRAFT_1274369 [Mycena galopus ATCC 62051]|nr:hypothetical protein K438DRAFT_1274369 [Mycena galopus ATCC 62051]
MVGSDQAANEYHRRLYANCLFISGWLAQANHIFDCLDITSDFENCVFMEGVQYRLWMSERGAPIPLGYLFLCPVAHLQSDSATFLRIPDCPAYWSLDPSGANRLNAEAAQDLGFPNIEFRFNVKVKSWDESVYAGIRKFHEAKGIVPCSEDAVMALGYPLVQLSCEREDLRE